MKARASRRPVAGTAAYAGSLLHPATKDFHARRYADLQLRVADWITSFAGSMWFVYLHAAAFALWMLVMERSPWPRLTLVVSLEAIFLSTFVLIGQNRQAALQQAKADHDFVAQELELRTNTEITRAIHALTSELLVRVPPADAHPGADEGPSALRVGTMAARPDATLGEIVVP